MKIDGFNNSSRTVRGNWRFDKRGCRLVKSFIYEKKNLMAVLCYNRAQALMSGAQIVVGEALGVKLGKDSMKFIEKQVMAKQLNQNNNQDGNLNE